MIVNLYAIFDRASGIYDGPLPGHSDAHIMRKFGDLAKNPDSDVGKHPGDFTLFRVGTWNDGTGKLVDTVTEKIVNGLEILAADDRDWETT